MLPRRPLPVLLVLLTACGPGSAVSEPGTAETSSGGSASGEPEPTGSTGSSTTGASTTDASTTDASTTGTTSVPGDTDTGGEVCAAPGPDSAQVTWTLEIDGAPVKTSVKAECEVVGAEVQGPETVASLTCEIDGAARPVVLRYALAPDHEIAWEPGQPSVLDYRREQPWWISEWLTVGSGGGVVFEAIRADALAPPGLTTADFFGHDFELGDRCVPEPDGCGLRQGLELRFPLPGGDPAVARVRSGEHSSFSFAPRVVVWVEHASRLLEPIECDDTPSAWIDAVIVQDCSRC